MDSGAVDAIMMDNSMLPPINSISTTRSSAKIDSVYTSVHAMEVISNLLKDACSYLEIYSNDNNSDNKLQLPCDCLRLAIDGLDQHANIIGQAIQNSSETKEVKYAQKKLIKSQIQTQKVNAGAMSRHPTDVLSQSLLNTQETLKDILSKTNPEFIKKRKKSINNKATNDDQVGNDASPAAAAAAKKKKVEEASPDDLVNHVIDVIDLPSTMDGKAQYTPFEAVAYINNIIESGKSKSYAKAYKDKMMEAKLVPVKKTQLNTLIKQYGGDNKVAPLNWNSRGVQKQDNLILKFVRKQKNGQGWSITDTKDAMMSEGGNEPHPEDVNAAHSTLITLHNLQNHINQQIEIQQERLKKLPPTVPVRKTQVVKKRPLKASGKSKSNFNLNDPKYTKIVLPPPADGGSMYTPSEAIKNISSFSQSGKSRSELRAVKEKMIATRVVPIGISQLNSLLAGGLEKAPTYWNQKGRTEIMSIHELAKAVQESNVMWNIENTREAIWQAKRVMKEGTDKDVKGPDVKTVNAYHTALLSMPELNGRVKKPESIKRLKQEM